MRGTQVRETPCGRAEKIGIQNYLIMPRHWLNYMKGNEVRITSKFLELGTRKSIHSANMYGS